MILLVRGKPLSFDGYGKRFWEKDQLNILHKTIIRVALALRKKTRVFDMITLFEKCCQEIPNPEPEIYQALKELYQMNYIVEGKRLIKHEILENEKRKEIFEYILKYPGAHKREIRKLFALGAYEAHVHLAFLMTFGFIRKNIYKNRNVYFPIDFEESKELETLILRNETTKKVFECIQAHEQVRLSELSDSLQIPYTTIQSHLQDLLEGELIEKIQQDKITYYVLTGSKDYERAVEVKREYDYVGGKIRFKIAVRNYTDMAIHNVGINVNPSDQFITDTPQQVIANLPPDSTRGVDFNLTPLTCGHSTVFGSVSFQDAYGKAHSITIDPKEISIKCPLVTPLTATQDEVNDWIQNLKKGTTKISYQDIPDGEAFRIGREQVSALDLKEIKVDSNEMWGFYSGQVKVTGKNTVVKVSIVESNIVLDVWADDLKQTTGFIAYITNLINIALEISYKVTRKTEDITRKITNLMKISSIADEAFTISHELGSIQEITAKLSKMQELMQEALPDSILIQSMKIWNSKLTSIFDPNVPIDAAIAIEFQFTNIRWMYKIRELIQTHVKMYQETFKDLTQISGDFSAGLDIITQRIAEHEKNYGLGILSYLMILDKKSGLTLFQKNLGDLKINPDLVGGFLHALQSFGLEISASEASMKTLTYEKYQFQIETGELVRVALILRGPPNQFLISRLRKFTHQFEQDFKDQIIQFSGNMDVFNEVNNLLETLFT